MNNKNVHKNAYSGSIKDRIGKSELRGRANFVKLPGHPVRTGQGRRASRQCNIINIVPLDPAHPAKAGGHLPAKFFLIDLIAQI